MEIPEVYGAVADWATSIGETNLVQRPGVWHHKLDDNWHVALNPHEEKLPVEPEGCMKVTLDPYNMAFWWNGWFAGVCDGGGGTIAAHPEGASEETLLAALHAATKEE